MDWKAQHSKNVNYAQIDRGLTQLKHLSNSQQDFILPNKYQDLFYQNPSKV